MTAAIEPQYAYMGDTLHSNSDLNCSGFQKKNGQMTLYRQHAANQPLKHVMRLCHLMP